MDEFKKRLIYEDMLRIISVECSAVKSCNLLVHANARPMVDSLSPSVLVWKGKVLNMYYTYIRKV